MVPFLELKITTFLKVNTLQSYKCLLHYNQKYSYTHKATGNAVGKVKTSCLGLSCGTIELCRVPVDL